jgi:hypothetical protein
MKNILKIRNNSNDETRTGEVTFSNPFNEIYPGLFNLYFNPGSDGSYISSYYSQNDNEYLFVFADGDTNVVSLGLYGEFDSYDFEFNEKITTQINQALWSNPGGGIVDITKLPVMEEYDITAYYMYVSSI